ncbi:carbohydrate porin [Vibrio sp. SM6]|uniref:Carbohydrate porin n=1 Tax=Vibrio agarilyticus TaxID=2726741 RepID=A0A7X8YGL9_9VIBR|nr:carbohydrate porin [Vibrio agarilyticus]NLS12517.1 carbohydrate porin [Vibrio agarilyticus]
MKAKLSLLALSVMALPAMANVEVSDMAFNGLIKSGTLWTKDGKGAESIRLTDMGRFRLGNENETKLDLNPSLTFEHDEGAWAHAAARFQSETRNTSDWADKSSGFVVREAYVEMGGFPGLPESVTFWAGKRYMKNRGTNILDWDYAQANGTGGGVWGIPVFDGVTFDFDVASWGRDDLEPEAGEGVNDTFIIKPRFDVSLGEGNGDAYAEFMSMKRDNSDRSPTTADDGHSVSVGWVRWGDFFGFANNGYGEVIAQYGKGLSAGSSLSKFSWGDWNYKDHESYRFLATGLVETDSWSAMPVFVYHRDNDIADKDGERTWIAAGIRPVFVVNQYVSIQTEYGYEHIDENSSNNAVKGGLHKFTIAPTLQLETGFWVRPQLRLFMTYATWDKELQNLKGKYGENGPGGNTFMNDTEGFMYGLQAEVWF